MNKFVKTSASILLLGLCLLCLMLPEKSEANETAETYLAKAERYTVKVRVNVKYPPLKDEKGSHTGAGFLIDAERGWIATNAHVPSRNPESLEIAFKGQKFIDAELLFVDRYLDLAVVQIPKERIPVGAKKAELQCTKWPEVGSRVGAYGHPLSLDFSVTTGIVSGLRYRHNRYWIQTDAAINRGNSGGPLINTASDAVLGINAIRYSKRSSEGLGFAVPMIYACRIFNLLREGKNPSVPYVPAAFATSDEVRNKLIVATTYEGLPVKWALQPGDQLVSLANVPAIKFKNQADLIHALRGREGTIAIKVIREGEKQVVSLPVQARPRMIDWVGLHFSGLVVGKELLRDAQISNPEDEIMILDVASASPGSVRKMKAYSYIYTVDGQKLTKVTELCSYLEKAAKSGKKVEIVTRRGSWDYMATFKYQLYSISVEGLKLVGPKVKSDKLCGL